MNYQNESLPKSAIKVGSTPSMTEVTVKEGILKSHLAPKGKIGYLVVEEGHCQYVWEDEDGPALDADLGHPIVIHPERYHHVIITGPVVFRVEFYTLIGGVIDVKHPQEKKRPGQQFL